MRTSTALAVIAGMLAVGGGCTGTGGGYGAQKRKVELRTASGNYEVFVVPNQDWLRRGAALTANRGEGLAPYSKGTAPATVYLPPYEHVLVARDPAGTVKHTPFVPRPNGSVLVDFGGGSGVGGGGTTAGQ